MDVGLPRPVARRLRERLPRLRPAEGALRARRRLRRRGRLQGPEVVGRPLVQERPQRRGQDGQGDMHVGKRSCFHVIIAFKIYEPIAL